MGNDNILFTLNNDTIWGKRCINPLNSFLLLSLFLLIISFSFSPWRTQRPWEGLLGSLTQRWLRLRTGWGIQMLNQVLKLEHLCSLSDSIYSYSFFHIANSTCAICFAFRGCRWTGCPTDPWWSWESGRTVCWQGAPRHPRYSQDLGPDDWPGVWDESQVQFTPQDIVHLGHSYGKMFSHI